MTDSRERHIITVFGSRSPLPGSEAYDTARNLGRLLAENDYAVCTGGYSGIMEAVSRGAREVGGHTIGVTVKTFAGPPNPFVVEEMRMPDLFARLHRLVALGGNYVVFDGGMGTIAELCLVWNLVQMKQLQQRRHIFVIGPSWNEILKQWRSATDIPAGDYALLELVRSPEQVVEALQQLK